MEKLKILVDGKEQIIMADAKVAKGIYLAGEGNHVKENIKKLKISFEDVHDERLVQNKVTVLGKWSFLSTKYEDIYYQYIFNASASEDDINDFTSLREISEYPQLKGLLIQAFSLCRLGR